MDSVRFGRALGFGARAAARTLVTAVDAATSPSPSAKPAAAPQSASRPAQSTSANVADQVARAASQVKQTSENLNRGGKQFGRSVWGPFVRLSGVLWLEFTGVFFGIFALFAANGAWKLRTHLHQTALNHDGHTRFMTDIAMAVVFTYFCVSSFLRAKRRERKGQ